MKKILMALALVLTTAGAALANQCPLLPRSPTEYTNPRARSTTRASTPIPWPRPMRPRPPSASR